MLSVVAAAQGSQWGLWAAVAAVIVDSVVTCLVGWRLNRTARRETAKAAESVRPALNDALGQAVVTLLPVITETIKKHLADTKDENAAIRSLPSNSGQQGTHNG